MALPKGIRLVEGTGERPFITLRNLTITFSKSVIEALKYPAFVHMFIGEADKIVVFQSCEKDFDAIPFYTPPEKGKQMFVRINSKEKAGMLMDLAGISDCGKGIRFYGDFLEEDQAFVFSLKKLHQI